MKILMCDDQPQFLNKLQKLLKEAADEMDIDICMIPFTNPEHALRYAKDYIDLDIIFMDILLGNKNGFEIAKEMRLTSPKTKIIFLSSTSAYALKGYDINATRYLMKPIQKSRLLTLLKEVQSELKYKDTNYIIERNDLGIHKLFLNEIIFIETFGRNTLIHTITGNYLSYKSMKEHESRLDKNFIRCHSSYIVNMEFIRDYKGYEIYLTNDDKIWVSKNRRKDFLHSLTNYYGAQLK